MTPTVWWLPWRWMNRLPRRGDHIRVTRGFYAHDGIYVGDGQVIHFWGMRNNKAEGRVRRDSVSIFLGRAKAIQIVDYGVSFADDEVVRRAYSRLGQDGYNVLFRNCQHFARWCKTDQHESDQVERVVTVATGASVARLASSLALAAVGAAAVEGTSGAAAIMSGLAGLGGTAVGGVVAVAAAPAVVATVATHRALRDDPFLPQSERLARRDGRWASTAGGLGGAGLSVALVSGAGLPGLGAAGITSGLTALGGSMVGGLLVVGIVPVAAAVLGGIAIYKLRQKPRSRPKQRE